jgi:hypothetical protein
MVSSIVNICSLVKNVLWGRETRELKRSFLSGDLPTVARVKVYKKSANRGKKLRVIRRYCFRFIQHSEIRIPHFFQYSFPCCFKYCPNFMSSLIIWLTIQSTTTWFVVADRS